MVNIHEAKTHLSRLVAEVEAGGEVVIARGGKPVAKLVPIGSPKRTAPRTFGQMRGQIVFTEGWDEPDPEMADLFENSDLHLD